MKNYLIETVSIDKLHVDLQNPRLPKNRAFIRPSSVMDYLQEKENILEIAESISENGLFPSEPLIAIKENDDFSVLEGNRRLVAMKLLINPALAIKFQQKFKDAASIADLTELQELRVIVYNSRLAAAPVLIKRHTNDPAKLRPWEMIMKAHYTTSFMATGKSLQEVSEFLSIDISSLRSDLETLQLYRLAQALPFDKSIKDKIEDEGKFSMSNLKRAVDAAAGSSLFRLTFKDSEGKLYLTFDKKEFLKPFAKLIMDIVNDDFNSRIANTAAEIETYFNNFNDKFKPNQTISGNESVEDVVAYVVNLKSLDDIYTVSPKPSPSPPPSQIPIPTPTPIPSPSLTPILVPSPTPSTTPISVPHTTPVPSAPKPKARKRKSVIFQDVNVVRNFSKQRVVIIVNELKNIDVDKFKNAAGVLLRTLLDIVTHEFIKSNGEDKIMENEALAKLKPTQKLREFWTPDLKPMLTRIINKKFGLPATSLSALNKHIGVQGPTNILYILNEIVHNPDFSFTKQDLLDVYDKLEPYIIEVL